MIGDFILITRENEAEFNAVANKVVSINRNEFSPFKDKSEFTLSKKGFGFATSATSQNVGVVAVLLDENKSEQEFWLSTLLKSGIEGREKVENNSEIAKIVRAELEKNPEMTNKNFGEFFIKLIDNKTIVCVRQNYVRTIKTKAGKTFDTLGALIGFEFKK